jgi:hypothetical protein
VLLPDILTKPTDAVIVNLDKLQVVDQDPSEEKTTTSAEETQTTHIALQIPTEAVLKIKLTISLKMFKGDQLSTL